MRTKTQCIVLWKKKKGKKKSIFQIFLVVLGRGGWGGRRGETRTVSISQSQVFTEARGKPWWINPLGQDLLLTVTQTLEQTNLHSHRHKLSVLIHARKHAKPILPFDSFSRAAPGAGRARGSPGPSPRLGFSAAGRQSSVRRGPGAGLREGWRDGGMERGTEAAHSPRLGPRRLHSPGKGVLAAPGAAWRGRARCLPAANQTQRSRSNRPWHVPLRRGREEEHKPRKDITN